ncbi:F0F1 ATP synthase subunit epsilon [Pelosinus sp. sgz500959]|uniref:F0F1 ATP synthase subunit epsilon n=1 Tax=Pelosinus sp. sgz500959 TaxID=3242472 RepID=UPI00366C6444
MAKTIRLDIVTPEKLVYSEDVNMVIARTTSGDIGILPGHAALVAALVIWPLRIITDSGEMQISVCNGFIEVQPEKITILANCAELPDEIDIARAASAKERAESLLRGDREKIDVARAEAALKRAITRLTVGNKHQK